MFSSLDVLQESISGYKNKSYKDNNIDIYEPIFESILDKFFDYDMNQYSESIKSELIKENNIFWANESTETPEEAEKEFRNRIQISIDHTKEIIKDLHSKLKLVVDGPIMSIRNTLDTDTYNMIKNNKNDIYFPNSVYNYTNLGVFAFDIYILNRINAMNRYIYTRTDHFDSLAGYGENIIKYNDNTFDNFMLNGRNNTKYKTDYLFDYYRDNGVKIEKTLYSPSEIMNCCTNAFKKYHQYVDMINADLNFFDDNLKDIQTIFNFEERVKKKNDGNYISTLEGSAKEFDNLMRTYLIIFASEIDALSEYVQTNNAIILEAINQIDTKSVYIYEVPENTKEDLDEKIELHQDLKELKEAFIYNETVVALESAGLITVNEETKEKFQMYFEKILEQMRRIIEKIQTTIRKKIAEQLTPVIHNLKSQDKPDPTFEIKNYKTFDFEKVKTIKPVLFDYNVMQEDLTSRETFLNKNYPLLKDASKPDNKNIYKIMLKLYVTEQTGVQCTPEMIDDFVNFLTNDYAAMLEGLDDFRQAIDEASKRVIPLAQQFETNDNRETQNFQNQQQAAAESVEISEAETTTFEDQKQTGNSGEGNTKLMKACTLYCSIMSTLLSSRIKFLNYAYNDRMKIVWHYVVKNKFNKQG